MSRDAVQVKKLCQNLTSLSRFIVGALLLSTLAGCGSSRERYTERHTIKHLTVVFLDEDSLHEQWKQISGSDAVRFQAQMNQDLPHVRTVKGFFDFASNTLYCPKWNFEVCGHELHHAALGHFHATN
jgi:hypothetical protein